MVLDWLPQSPYLNLIQVLLGDMETGLGGTCRRSENLEPLMFVLKNTSDNIRANL